MVAYKSVLRRWLCAVVFCFALAPAWSALGESIWYTNGSASIYGAPAVYGDTLLFSPAGFSSTCSGVNGVNMVDGLLRVWIESPLGIDDVTVQEGGACFFFGHATGATQAYVGALAARLFITEVGGQAVSGGALTIIPGTMSFTPSSSEVGSRTFNATEPIGSAGWQGTMLFTDVNSALAGTPYAGGHVTGVMLVFDDVLATASEAGTVAMIDKKWVSVRVPEPGALMLLAAGLALGLACVAWRRRKAALATFCFWLVETVEKRNG
jgi:hypothetical protein